MSNPLNLPPFPALEWDDYAWTCPIVLPAWAGFQSRRGPYASRSALMPSDGSALLYLMPPDDMGAVPTPEQAAAYRHLMDHQEATRDAILQAIFDRYPDEQKAYGYEGEEAEELMPDLQDREQLRAMIGLSNVHLFPVVKDGIAYIGFEFGCCWDDEHGLGAMTHAGRIVEVGGADTAILEWIATHDAEKAVGELGGDTVPPGAGGG